MKAIDISGQRFGRLLVTGRAGSQWAPNRKATYAMWRCICDCGKSLLARGANLRSGNTKSCGCYDRDRNSEVHSREVVTYHGLHHRLARLKGSAREHPCVDCEAPGREWSYDGRDPNERRDDKTGLVYSLDPQRYVARCKRCHYLFDLDQEHAS